ncbi:MAG: IPExxxVDY family protein [Schleiferiaceae bacterium]|jgi:hypothetical protein|nr:IPExxxVDY family protein [Schleiferiaceae bacterium]MDR9442185.1 IPExxxVDY family protein [Schleiferiaceae bacterium]
MPKETLDLGEWCLEREVAGIISDAGPVMLAYHINKTCGLKLVRPAQDLQVITEDQTHRFVSFCEPREDGSSWWLLSNRSYTKHEKKLAANTLFEEVYSQVHFFYQRQNADYFLWHECENEDHQALSKIHPLLRKVPYLRGLHVFGPREKHLFNQRLQY